MEKNDDLRRDELLENIRAKLRVLFPDGTDHAPEKRAEVLAYAAGEVFGRREIGDVAVAAALPLADIEKLWRAVDAIVDAH